jgi:uncharacterized protein (DUF2252 family)
VAPRYNWSKIAQALRAHPMEWALIFERGHASRVNRVRDGRVAAVHPDLGFEVVTVNNTRGRPRTCDLYMRWNPDLADPLRMAVTGARYQNEPPAGGTDR